MRRFTALFILLLLLTGATTVRAQDDPELRQRLQDERAKLRAAMHAEQSLLRQIYAIEHVQYRHEKTLADTRNQLAEVQHTIDNDIDTIARMDAQMPVRNARLSRRLAALYRMGRGGFWKVLMTSDSFGAFVRRYRALRRIVELDAELLARHRVEIIALRERRARLLRQQAELTSLIQREKDAALEVEVEKRKRVFVLETIQQDKYLALRLTRELEQQDAALRSRIEQLPSPPPPPTPAGPLRLDFAGLKGYLAKPVSGPIVERYGVRIHEQFGTQTRSNGIEIAATLGEPVRCVADGTVRFIGEFIGYGRVVIVDHGDRYHTLYAHLAGFQVAKGDVVRQGQILGTVGASGLSDRPTLHFEVRYKGAAIDPMGWLATP